MFPAAAPPPFRRKLFRRSNTRRTLSFLLSIMVVGIGWMEGRKSPYPSIHPSILPKRNSICAMSDKPSWQIGYTRMRPDDGKKIHRRHKKMRVVRSGEGFLSKICRFASCRSADRLNHNSQLIEIGMCKIAERISNVSSGGRAKSKSEPAKFAPLRCFYAADFHKSKWGTGDSYRACKNFNFTVEVDQS